MNQGYRDICEIQSPLYSNECCQYYPTSNIDIPKKEFLFSAIGNYTVGTAGWGISQVQITSRNCSEYCLLCKVEHEIILFIISFKCKTCKSGYLNYRDVILVVQGPAHGHIKGLLLLQTPCILYYDIQTLST